MPIANVVAIAARMVTNLYSIVATLIMGFFLIAEAIRLRRQAA